MKLLSHLFLALTVTLITACGGGSSSASEMSDVMAEITTVLKDVQDADGAEAAKSKLEPLMEKMNQLTQDAAKEAQDNPGKAAESMDADEAKKFAEVTTAYSAELTRIMSDPALGAKLTEVLTPKAQ